MDKLDRQAIEEQNTQECEPWNAVEWEMLFGNREELEEDSERG